MRLLNTGPRPLKPERLQQARAPGFNRRLALYASPRWRASRIDFLLRNPLCASCSARGIHEKATVVDHVRSHALPGWEERFWDPSNWQPLCVSCHNAKSASEQRNLYNHRDLLREFMKEAKS
jgi:5-methylcytosine-specific restriction endonuclease McrA